MKRVAIPVSNQRLSEYFGECEHYEIFEIDRKVTGKKTVAVPEGTDITELPGWLEKNGVTDVITFKVNPKIITLFASKKLNLYVGIPSGTTSELIEEYLQGRLESDENIIKEITNNEY